MVIVAGPGVATAIRNQFGAVTGVLTNGISKGDWEAGGGGSGSGTTSDVDIYDPMNGTAFAVYSEDDHSLMFYKRRGVPKVGDMFNYRRVTEVYMGFENTTYASISVGEDATGCPSINNGDTNCPWYAHHNDVESVSIIDSGIKPITMKYWFQRFTQCKTFNLSKLDASRVWSLQHAFWLCESVCDLDLSVFATSPLKQLDSAMSGCSSLESVDLTGWKTMTNPQIVFSVCPRLKIIKAPSLVSLSGDCQSMLRACPVLVFDCSSLNVSEVTNHTNFNLNSPGVTLPKVWR